MQKILMIIIQFGVILFAISIHESAHAWMANKFGDPTAKNQGRITLNPIPHIDLIGTIIFPLVLAIAGAPVFGWAKPVMVNPYNLRDPKRANIFISAAGPGSNIITAIGGIVLFLILKNIGVFGGGAGSGSDILLFIFFFFIVINIYLAIFNLIPIPPLDGSGIIEGVLKGEALYNYQKIKPFGFIILLIIIYIGVLDVIANPIISFVLNILRG
ncbi:MAG: site-2 protease family protein [Candidatus Aminicenantes bacterium]|nr:MAG: site-2 protease family protein [Candidatus Aminicenantes bacterium]